jgi:hypothetical protein
MALVPIPLILRMRQSPAGGQVNFSLERTISAGSDSIPSDIARKRD